MALATFSEWFWNPVIWLPPGLQWKDLIPNEKTQYPDPDHIYYPIPFALALILVRYIVERVILYPLGQFLGLKKTLKHSAASGGALGRSYDILEKEYHIKSNKLTHRDYEALAKRTDLKIRQVERWMRRRLARDKPSTLAKFSESGWRCICYATSLTFGIWVLWDKPYFWDINHCWYDFPHHSVPLDVWCYYAYGASMYMSFLITQFFDVKRKDFWEMFLHHILTITMFVISWYTNFLRIVLLILVLHDSADAFLEAAKMCKYSKYQRSADAFFAAFLVVWVITRLGIFPFYILNNTIFESIKIGPIFPPYYMINGMLVMLLGLHIFWTYFIVKAAYKALVKGGIDDTRSSSESGIEMDDSDENENMNENSTTPNKSNGPSS